MEVHEMANGISENMQTGFDGTIAAADVVYMDSVNEAFYDKLYALYVDPYTDTVKSLTYVNGRIVSLTTVDEFGQTYTINANGGSMVRERV